MQMRMCETDLIGFVGDIYTLFAHQAKAKNINFTYEHDTDHLPIWIDPTSNHYGDSVVGFGITILIWAFAMAAIYRATKSVIACAIYHAFIDSIGAVYDWNALFDGFPGSVSTNVYRIVWLTAGVVLWLIADKKERHSMPVCGGQ